MASPRENVCRNFKKNEKLFLNYDSQKPIHVGDIIYWDGKKAEFNLITTLDRLGINPKISPSPVISTKLYNSQSGVKSKFTAKGITGMPTVTIEYRGASKYSLQAFETKIEKLDEIELASDITDKIDSNSLNWDKDWIVITSVWKAKAFTKFITSEKKAEANIIANSSTINAPFNIANISIGVKLGPYNGLSSHDVAGKNAFPFFAGMKYKREQGKMPYMVRYGKDSIISRMGF